MAKVNVRFIYRTQQDQEVKQIKSVHKGPINLTNLYEAYANPSYHEIDLNENQTQSVLKNEPNDINFEKDIPAVPSVEVISKPNSPKAPQDRPKQAQGVSAQQPFPQQLNTKQSEKVETLKPAINLEQIYESELIKKQQKKKSILKPSEVETPEGQIVLKSPSFKYIPKKEGDPNSAPNKKQYVRAEKAQKYLYNGIPERSEDDFVGCFGCFDKKAKTYHANDK